MEQVCKSITLFRVLTVGNNLAGNYKLTRQTLEQGVKYVQR